MLRLSPNYRWKTSKRYAPSTSPPKQRETINFCILPSLSLIVFIFFQLISSINLTFIKPIKLIVEFADQLFLIFHFLDTSVFLIIESFCITYQLSILPFFQKGKMLKLELNFLLTKAVSLKALHTLELADVDLDTIYLSTLI